MCLSQRELKVLAARFSCPAPPTAAAERRRTAGRNTGKPLQWHAHTVREDGEHAVGAGQFGRAQLLEGGSRGLEGFSQLDGMNSKMRLTLSPGTCVRHPKRKELRRQITQVHVREKKNLAVTNTEGHARTLLTRTCKRETLILVCASWFTRTQTKILPSHRKTPLWPLASYQIRKWVSDSSCPPWRC